MDSIVIETRNPAEIYDEYFVPALFAQWGPRIADAVGIHEGDHVLDVACGTGALTLEAARRAGPQGRTVGVDANAQMLAVARTKPVRIEWIEAHAERLPGLDGEFDAVVSQFGLMFFDDPSRALREMMRVLRPGGRLAVAVWDALENCGGYAALARVLEEEFGSRIASAFRAPFVLGDAARLRAICTTAGIDDASVRRWSGDVRFASLDELLSTERACAWTLGGLLDDAQFERLRRAAQPVLSPWVRDGFIEFEMPALVITARKPERAHTQRATGALAHRARSAS